MSDTVKKTNWVVRVYDVNDDLLAAWVIENRTEFEAENEAYAEAQRIPHEADWTITEHDGPIDTAPIPIEYKAPLFERVPLSFEVRKIPSSDHIKMEKTDPIKRDSPKIGRNSPCPCGKLDKDGKPIKYKKCCGAG